MSKRLWVVLFCVALAPSAYLGWTARDVPHLGYRWDDGLYWVCAKSLAESSGYRLLSLPAQPYQTKYPPLFAWVLSLAWRINPHFPDNLPLAMLLCWVTLPVYLALSYSLLRRMGFGPVRTWILCAVLALNPYVVLLSVSLMSEPLFTCLVLTGLLLNRSPVTGPGSRWRWLGAGVVAGGAYLAKTSGLALLALPLLHLVRKQRARAAWFCAGMLPAVVCWVVWRGLHAAPGRDMMDLYYTDYVRFHLYNFSWGDLPLLLWKNVSGLWLGAGGFFLLGVEEGFWGNLFRVVIAGLALAGLVRLLQAGRAAEYAWFAGACLGLLLFWHLGPGDWYERLLYPMAPLVLAGLSEALLLVARWIAGLLRATGGVRVLAGGLLAAGLVCGVVVFALSNLGTVAAMPGLFDRHRMTKIELRQVYRWMAEHLPQHAALLTLSDEALTYLYANRRGMAMTTPPRLLYYNDEEGVYQWWGSFASVMRTHKLRYVLTHSMPANPRTLDAKGHNHLIRVLADSPEVRLIYRVGRTAIYELAQ